ncbi:hypothetical protein BZM26_25365 [Paraburkholderia strydomiana]|nr:hypothetical protein BZM26_25365 [Paraburkholderia strydomiana]
MNIDALIGLATQGLLLCLYVSLPIVVIAAGVGLVVSFLQAVTSLQDQTLSFGVKLVAVVVALVVPRPFRLPPCCASPTRCCRPRPRNDDGLRPDARDASRRVHRNVSGEPREPRRVAYTGRALFCRLQEQRDVCARASLASSRASEQREGAPTCGRVAQASGGCASRRQTLRALATRRVDCPRCAQRRSRDQRENGAEQGASRSRHAGRRPARRRWRRPAAAGRRSTERQATRRSARSRS